MKTTDVILSMTVKIIVMKKDVVYVRLNNYSQFVPTLPHDHTYVQMLSFLLLYAWSKKEDKISAPVYFKKVIVYTALPFFSAVNYFWSIGLVLGLSFLSLLVGIPTCIGVIVCYRKRKRTYHRLQSQDHVITATPSTGASVDTSNQTASMANPVFHAQPQYSQQPQQPVDQLSSEDTSPSSTATATTQQPSQVIFFTAHIVI